MLSLDMHCTCGADISMKCEDVSGSGSLLMNVYHSDYPVYSRWFVNKVVGLDTAKEASALMKTINMFLTLAFKDGSAHRVSGWED